MAAKKKTGLGRGLTNILAEEGRIGSNREMRQLIPLEPPSEEPEDHLQPFNMFGSPRVRDTPTLDAGEVGGLNVDYNTQYVGDARPPKDNYGQGPDRSTRVASHKFVPHPAEQKYLLNRAGVTNNAVNTLGTVYVKFHKRGDTYKYSHVPESVYNSFANSTSKGRFINQFLNSYKYGRIGSRDDRFHTGDF
jgi:hypothetical protein